MFHFSQWVDLLLKAQGHRYLKRIPYMSGGKRRYRYIYKVTHTHRGKQAFDEAHLVDGTAFSLSSQRGNEFHGHIKSVNGDRVTYVIDDGPDKGKEVTESKRDLLAKLNETHGITEQVGKEREKLKQQIELAKQKGSEKQVKLLEERLTRLGGSKKQPEPQPEQDDPRSDDPIVTAEFDINAIQDAIDNGHDLTPVIVLQKQFIEKRDAGLLTPALLQESLRIYETMIEPLVLARVKKKKKDLLLQYIASNISMWTASRMKSEKKQEVVDTVMDSFLRNVTNTPLLQERRNNVTYSFYEIKNQETYAQRIKRLVGEYTEEDAIEDKKRLADQIETAKQQQAEKERLLSNPQTAQDYIELKRLRRNKGEDLTDEQHAKHNDLVARRNRDRREAEKTKQAPPKKITGGFESFDTKHSKTGADLFAVRPAERVDREEYMRLKAEAKKLGGYYSSYSTVRGFVFPSTEAREQFIQANQQPETTDTQEPVDTQRAKRDALRERLESYRDSANEALSADRLTNTARRARFARSATEDAYRQIERVNRGQRILNAIDEGRAYHLQNISNAIDLDSLQSIVDRAKSMSINGKGLSWDEYQKQRDKLKSAPIPQQIIESQELYPDKLKLWPSDIKTLRKYLTRSDGTARSGASMALRELNAMLSEPKEKLHSVPIDTLLRVLAHVPPETDKSYGVLSQVMDLKRDHDRLKRLGIENELELKATIREYEDIAYQRSAEDKKADKEAEEAKAERDRLIRRGEFARMNIPSYFPTPANVIDRMIEIAGIGEGETVLEPSAGAGHILEKLADTKASVKAIEANAGLRNYLEDQGHDVVGNDALQHSDTYDHVIMNPPFEKQADIDHVTHAFENNLVNGGRLVAVMSASAMTRDNKKSRDFQDLVNKYGHYEKLPEGTFKDSDRQTGVSTILVTLDLPIHGLSKSFSFSSIVEQLLLK